MAGDRVPLPVPGDHHGPGSEVGRDRRGRDVAAAGSRADSAARALNFIGLAGGADASAYSRMYRPFKHPARNSRQLALLAAPRGPPPLPRTRDPDSAYPLND